MRRQYHRKTPARRRVVLYHVRQDRPNNPSATFLPPALEMSGNVFFNAIPSHSRWFIFIPISNPRFCLALFPLTSHSCWLFPFPPALILVLLVVSHQITNDRSTSQYCYKKKKNNQILKNTQAVSKQAVSHGHPE